MSAKEQAAPSTAEIAEMNRVLQKVLAKEQPTDQELEVLRRLGFDVVDLFPYSRRVDD
jgi:hypothetical protein